MKKIVILSIICFSFWAQKVYAVSVCPGVFWANVIDACPTGEVNLSLRICPNDEADPNVVFDHVEWNLGNGTVISNSSLSLTYNYSTGGIYQITAEVFFLVNGMPCSTIAKRVMSYSSFGAPWVTYFEWLETNTNVINIDHCLLPDPTLLSNYAEVAISILNADMWISPTGPYTVGDNIDINVDIANLAPVEVINYTISVDNAVIHSGMYTTNGVQTATYLIPALPAGLTAGTHVIEFYGVDTKRPTCPIIRTLIIEVQAEEPPPPCEHCLTFRPDPNKRYWVSGWVKVVDASASPNSIPQVISYDNGTDASTAGIELSFVGSTTPPVYFRPSGEIIEGWQRIAGEFTTPSGALEVNIKLNHPVPGVGQNKVAFFDDIRIHPFNGSMKSYVNDPDTFWLTAELDDNNYATFYEYDMEGKLIRIKKETSRGIVTIKENRSSNPKTN